ncbi:MAG: antitoxin, RHH family protein [Armatimonadota bacterium]
MSTKNPRIMVVLEPSLYDWIKQEAKRLHISISLFVRDLIKKQATKEQLDELEDEVLGEMALERFNTFDPKKALSHEQIKKKLGL